LQIGEVAKRVGVSVRTVRYYEELDLLLPSGLTSGGMRLYTEQDVVRLRFIYSLRKLQMSLDEIKLVLDGEQTPDKPQERAEHTIQLLQLEQARIDEQISALQELHDEVDNAMDRVDRCLKCEADPCPGQCSGLDYLL
jgi:MerR family Zn(II)-responsive transcriptional regulator of zntA